jgi:hypothetical protein
VNGQVAGVIRVSVPFTLIAINAPFSVLTIYAATTTESGRTADWALIDRTCRSVWGRPPGR